MFKYHNGNNLCEAASVLALDASALAHKNANMRTTLDIPDEIYRSLKARAALAGVPVRSVVVRLIDLGLRADHSTTAPKLRRELPPVAISPTGIAIPALSREEMARAEEAEDEARLARSA